MNTYQLEKKAKEIWLEYIRNNKLPPFIPPNPDEVYKNKGWKSWAEWLGFINIEMN